MDLSKMQDMLSQATAMREQMEQRLAETIVEADSGGGAVTARMNGKKELLKLTIAPAALAAAGDTGVPGDPSGSRGVDITMLEDLIVAAINAAARKADAALESSASSLLGGLNIPGL